MVASGQSHMCLLALAFYYGRDKEEGPYRTLVTSRRADAWLYESHAGQTSRSNMRRNAFISFRCLLWILKIYVVYTYPLVYIIID